MDALEELAKLHGRIILYTAEDRAFLEERERSLKAHREKVLASKESAMQELIDAGIYTVDGQMHPRYR
jgi:hypothetical protein